MWLLCVQTLKEADFQRIHQDLDNITVRNDEMKRMRALEAQFRAKQAEWGYAHWGELIAVWTDESSFEVENPDTHLKEKLDGVCWILCQPPAGTPFARTALGWRFAWSAPWNSDTDKFGDPVLLNAPGRLDGRNPDPRVGSHVQWQVLRVTAKAARAVAAKVKELEDEKEEHRRNRREWLAERGREDEADEDNNDEE